MGCVRGPQKLLCGVGCADAAEGSHTYIIARAYYRCAFDMRGGGVDQESRLGAQPAVNQELYHGLFTV
jgi:hypothetical protein